MKRLFTIILITILTVPFIQSCDKSGSEYPTHTVLATVLPYWNDYGFACQLDNGETLYPGRVRIGYKVNQEKAQRAVISFSEINEAVPGFTYNADIFNIADVTTKDIEVLRDSQNDTLNDALKVNAMVLSGDYFNVDFSAMINPYATNQLLTISLVDNRINGKPEYDEYYPLELKFKCTPEVSNKAGQTINTMACFYVGPYSLDGLGCKGYKISYKDMNSNGEIQEIIIEPNMQ